MLPVTINKGKDTMPKQNTKKNQDNTNNINEDIDSAYEAAQYLERIKHRNRALVRWTKFGEVIVNEKTKRSS